ncbi:MAG: signal peptidase II [Clostridia bacterium]|nr:signal peptidase II [Clostridia bacterium]
MIALSLVVIVAVVAVDLITKFNFDGILNSGIAWSLGADVPWLWIVVVVFSLVLTIVLLLWLLLGRRRWLKSVGLGLFIGGIVGNALDRLISGGAVHDFINFGIFRNNIADIALTVGAVLMVLHLIMEETRASR